MAIRAQCNNCGKVYNLPDESAGKRLRCKQCAVAFTVPSLAPAAEAPTLGPQKICVVCNQNVAGRPRTKDQAGNYYCRSCYEEKARSREQLAQSRVGAAVPAGVGAGGDGGGDDEIIDLGALEPTEQFDESMQPPPPPIPDMDLVAPPLPDMQEPMLAEPVMLELPPKPKKKKKKKKGAAAKAAAGDSAMDKIKALPIELWIFAVCAVVFCLGLLSSSMAGTASTVLSLVGTGCGLWGDIAIIFIAFSEGTVTGLMVLFLPFYGLVFIITHWSEVSRHFGRSMLGLLFVICSFVITGKQVADHVVGALKEGQEKRMQDFSTDPSYVVRVNLLAPSNDETTMKQDIAAGILEALKQHNVKPAEGQYIIEASVRPDLDFKNKITITREGQQMQMPSPKLVCTLQIKDSQEQVIYEQSKDSLPDPAMLQVSDRTRKSGDEFQKELWKNVVSEFKTMALAVPAAADKTAPADAKSK